MPQFAHDPRRLHPPANLSGRASIAEEELVPAGEPAPRHLTMDEDPVIRPHVGEPEDPYRTQQEYQNLTATSRVSVALGELDKPHRIVYCYTNRRERNLGYMRALVEQIVSDFDHDQRDSEVIIRNVEPDCVVPQLQAFFESLGYVLQEVDPPTLYRVKQPYEATSND